MTARSDFRNHCRAEYASFIASDSPAARAIRAREESIAREASRERTMRRVVCAIVIAISVALVYSIPELLK